MLLHFSHDPSIRRFVPHIPSSDPTGTPGVWATDEEHAPLHWFPPECPRVTVRAGNAEEQWLLSRLFATDAGRIHACELAWVARMRSAELFAYSFDQSDFRPLDDADGQWICDHEVSPVDVTPVGDLIERHVSAAIELRFVPTLWPMHDLIVGSGLQFGLVRMADAAPRRRSGLNP